MKKQDKIKQTNKKIIKISLESTFIIIFFFESTFSFKGQMC